MLSNLIDDVENYLKSNTEEKSNEYTKYPSISTNERKAIENINNSAIDSLIVSNSIDIGDKLKKCPKIDVFDVAPILSEAINRLKTGDSISELFK